MSAYRTLARHAAHYLGGRVVLLLLGILSFPLLTRVFGVQQYGELSLILKSVVCLVVLAKLGVQNSVVRFFAESRSSEDRLAGQRFYSTYFFGGVALAAAAGAALALVLWLAPGAKTSQEWRVPLGCAVLLVAVRAIWSTLSSFFQAEGRTVTYNVFDISLKAGSLAALVAGFAWLGRTLDVFFSATVAVETALVALAAYLVARRGVLRLSSVDLQLFRAAILYGLPLAAYEISSIVLDGGDRFLVLHYLGTKQLGYYAAAYNLSSYAQVSVMAPVNLAIIPIYMRLWKERGVAETRDFLSSSLDAFVIVAVALAMTGSLLAGSLLVALASAKYAAAAPLLPILIAAMLIYALHIFFTPGLLIYKKTATLARQVVCATLLNLGLNVVLLPRTGIVGGAWATLLGYLFLVAALARASRALLPVAFAWRSLVFRAAVAGALYLAASAFLHRLVTPGVAWSAAAAFVALLLYGVAIGALDPAGRRWTRHVWQRLPGALPAWRKRNQRATISV